MSVKDNRGATLVELIVSIAIFGVIAAAALGLLLFATNINSDVTADTIEMSRVYQSLDVVKSSAAASEKLKVGYVENTEVTINTATGSFNWTAQGGSLVYSTVGGSVVLVEGIEAFSVTRPDGVAVTHGSEYENLYLSLKMASGREYNLLICCKNKK